MYEYVERNWRYLTLIAVFCFGGWEILYSQVIHFQRMGNRFQTLENSSHALKNAFQTMKNEFQGLKNEYQKMENHFQIMEHRSNSLEKCFQKMENRFQVMKNHSNRMVDSLKLEILNNSIITEKTLMSEILKTQQMIKQTQGFPQVEKLEKAIVKLRFETRDGHISKGTGTLVCIKSRCFIATVSHIMGHFNWHNRTFCRYEFGFARLRSFSKKIKVSNIYILENNDLALLEIDCSIYKKYSLSISNVTLSRGENLFGLKLFESNVFQRCYISDIYSDYYFTTCGGIPGSSGTGFVNENDILVAIFTGSQSNPLGSFVSLNENNFSSSYIGKLWDQVHHECFPLNDSIKCLSALHFVVIVEANNPSTMVTPAMNLQMVFSDTQSYSFTQFQVCPYQ